MGTQKRIVYKLKNDSKKMPLAAKICIGIVAVLVIGGLGAWMYINGKLGLINKIIDEGRIDPGAETFETGENNGGESIDANDVYLNIEDIRTYTDSDVINILLIGCDARPGETRGRSDSMMICSIKVNTKEIKLTSLMRDIYVSIPGFSDNRLNAAYAFGGISLLDETIEKNLGIHIDGNVAVDFESFVQAISAVGDLDIVLSAEEASHLNTAYISQGWHLKEGVNSLTPEQTLAYSRIRHMGHGDFDRTERQRTVIKAAFNKIKAMPFSEIMSLADTILPCFSTDMSNREILSYVAHVATGGYTLSDTLRVPVDGAWKYAMINGTMAVILPDLQKNSDALKEFIYGQAAQQ